MEKVHFEWVDVARAIAIIFVYLGHWNTDKVGSFAYAFHLQMFFIIAGFFAANQQKYSIKEFLKKRFWAIEVPLFLWAWISLIITHLNTEFKLIELKELFLHPEAVQPNYWFMPVMFSVSITYYFLSKLLKNNGEALLLLYIIHILFGETPVIPAKYNIFTLLSELPILNIVDSWFSISGLPQFCFWYALGAWSFEYIQSFIKLKDGEYQVWYHSLGFFMTFISSLLFLKKITGFEWIGNIIYKNNFVLENYKIICTLIIICAIFYISTLLEKSVLLKEIGTSTMGLMGLEYITHGYIPLILLPMLNLGIPSIVNTEGVITVTAGAICINMFLMKLINKYMPILNGKKKWGKNLWKNRE